MVINGIHVPHNRFWVYAESTTYVGDYYTAWTDDSPNYARFGGCTTDFARNFVADATYDDIYAFSEVRPAGELQEIFSYGRYYNESDAVYTSPKIDIHSLLDVYRKIKVQIRSVSWTLSWPRYNERRLRAAGNIGHTRGVRCNILDPTDPMAPVWRQDWDPVSVDVSVREGEWIFHNNPDFMATYCGGSEIPHRSIPDRLRNSLSHGEFFQFKVYFNLAPCQTLLESPRLEDISFTIKTGKPGIVYWRVEK
ncbi:hypothetical protein ACFL54_06895 [Planctomycetota bacterium]